MKMALIVLGAAVGGPMRFVIDQKIRTYTTKPYGIFTVNILGSFLLGLTYGKVEEGFDLIPGVHPIVPVMFSSELSAVAMAKALFDRGIYAVAFSYPVVPMGKSRIRIQLSASHTLDEIRECVKAFVDAREEISI